MKVTVNVDCTPDEARAFFGLPDVKPMQDQLLQEVQQRLSANIGAMDPQTMIRTWPGRLRATATGFFLTVQPDDGEPLRARIRVARPAWCSGQCIVAV